MSTDGEHCSLYERDLRALTVDREYARALFMARPSVMLGARLSIDGNKWCALFGENLQDGVAGFGNTPDEAMEAFDGEWIKPFKKAKECE